MPLQATSGAASYDAFGGGVAVEPVYIEQIFSTYLYTGNGSTQTITNGIDLSTKGGLVWIKQRDGATARQHVLVDTVRGAGKTLASNLTSAQTTDQSVSAFSSTGFTVVDANPPKASNDSPINYASWTFRKAPKFFDVVTYTGDGANYRTISHSLGSTPGCVIVKSTSASGSWAVWHRSVDPKNLILNSTSGAITGQFSIQDVSATSFAVANSSFYGFPQSIPVNENGATYVAYIFAHDAGGFGLTGTDNVISCGSVSATGSTLAEVNLGWEPQWLLIKGSNITNGWSIIDNMRKFTADSGVSWLQPNTSAAEVTSPTTPSVYLTSTGFKVNSNESPLNGTGNYIYIAIRRGPMKVPTSGTSVYNEIPRTGTGTAVSVTGVGFPPDLVIGKRRTAADEPIWFDKLRGATKSLFSSDTSAEATDALSLTSFDMDGFSLGTDNSSGKINFNGRTYANWAFRRAPSFFDEVCYTGVGGTASFNHNLGVAPELIFVKSRSAANGGLVYNKTITASKYLKLFFTSEGDRAAVNDTGGFAGVEPTSSVFTVDFYSNVNTSGATYTAYLFATAAGVSKVGSYTGTATTLQIDCGFTSGARFVLIKRTDASGDWYVWDSARGIVSGNDSYLLLNSTAAEVTNTDYIDTYSAGFEISSTAPAAINASGGTFIFLAIA